MQKKLNMNFYSSVPLKKIPGALTSWLVMMTATSLAMGEHVENTPAPTENTPAPTT